MAQTRNLTRCCILMQNAFGHAAHDFRLRRLQCLLGDFLDFWDAFMWLVAFVFVEMNLFQWQVETSEVIAEDAVN